jgi:hypothetical protein
MFVKRTYVKHLKNCLDASEKEVERLTLCLVQAHRAQDWLERELMAAKAQMRPIAAVAA